jgi:hypothetical protein
MEVKTEQEIKKLSPRRRIDYLLDRLIEAENDFEHAQALKELEAYCPTHIDNERD